MTILSPITLVCSANLFSLRSWRFSLELNELRKVTNICATATCATSRALWHLRCCAAFTPSPPHPFLYPSVSASLLKSWDKYINKINKCMYCRCTFAYFSSLFTPENLLLRTRNCLWFGEVLALLLMVVVLVSKAWENRNGSISCVKKASLKCCISIKCSFKAGPRLVGLSVHLSDDVLEVIVFPY